MLDAMGRSAVREAVQADGPAQQPVGWGAVEVVTGAEAVAGRLLGLRLSAVEEVCAMLTGRVRELTPDPAAALPGPGAHAAHRTVVEHSAPFRPAAGGRTRVVDRIPAELVIADRRVALVPLASGAADSAALVVHAGTLLDALVDLFEDVWHEGRPLRPVTGGTEESHAPDATDLQVLSLLLAGLTDASAAKQLGLGLRTVQRRVKRLMEIAGVTTRLQLGWHAAERGWVTPR